MSDPKLRTLKDTSQLREVSGYIDQEYDDPSVMLRISKNGGRDWSNEHWQRLGQIGDIGHRIIWRRLGRARDPVFELSGTSPVKIAILAAMLDADLGIS